MVTDNVDALRAYRVLRAEADRVKWPRSFRTDLTKHDRSSLANVGDPSLPFCWILRETGTHLAFPGRIDGVGHRGSQYATMVAGAFGREFCRFYFWDGLALTEYQSPNELDARMLEVEQAIEQARVSASYQYGASA